MSLDLAIPAGERTRASRRTWRPPGERRQLVGPVAIASGLLFAHALYGAEPAMAALLAAALLCIGIAGSILIAGPQALGPGDLAALGIILAYGATGLAGHVEKALPSLIVLFVAVGVWAAGLLAGRGRASRDAACLALVWTSLAFCIWLFISYVAAILTSAETPSLAASFSSPASASLLFGSLTLLGAGRFSHVLKRSDADGLARSEVLDRVISEGLGGLLLCVFAAACLFLAGSSVGLILCAAALVIHLWWDLRSILLREHRGLALRVAGYVAPVLAAGLAGWGVALAWLQDETVSAAAGLGDLPRLARFNAYLDAWREASPAQQLFGHGLGSAEAVGREAAVLSTALALSAPGDAQNVLTRWLVEAGVFGTALFALLLLVAVFAAVRSLGETKAPRTFPRLALALAFLLALHGAAHSSLDMPSVIWLFGFLLGLSAGVRRSRAGGYGRYAAEPGGGSEASS